MALAPNIVRLRDLLLSKNVVDDIQMRSALAHLDKWGGRLANAVVELGFVDEDDLTQLLSETLRVERVHLGMVPPDPRAIRKLDAAYCLEHGVFPVRLDERLVLAMADPTEVGVVDEVQRKASARVQIVIAGEGEIRAAITRHHLKKTVKPEENRARRVITNEASEVMPVISLDDQPTSPAVPKRRTTGVQAVNALLDEMLGPDESLSENSPEFIARVEAVRATQEKAKRILRALRDLLREKGVLRGE